MDNNNRVLERSRSNRMLGGICGGLGKLFISLLALSFAHQAEAKGVTIRENSSVTIDVDTTISPVIGTTYRILSRDFREAMNVSTSIGRDATIKIRKADIGGHEEAFRITVKDGKVLIEGSDARGMAYGMLKLSEMMGVSPWEWWADVPMVHVKDLALKEGLMAEQWPSVRYRGIFINDEDWGMKPWSSKNYEKELGDIGPKTYAKVCELLLRLRGNMLAPAMHTCTGAFYTHPESKVVAHQYGIMITTSHCEPMLFNNADKSEWNKERDGEWNYKTNKEVVRGKMDARVKEAAPYDNIYTTAMRGVHDAGLTGNLTREEKVQVLTEVIHDQREILRKYLGDRPAPQIFVPYKECLNVYEDGLQVPEDITLVWPDDNYGYMKRLSNPEEQKRSGRSGVYYHVSYLGAPHDYLWLCTTPPMLMYEELRKAYLTGGDRYWLLNVGDIKPAELDIQTFFDMAWDIDNFSYDNINLHQSEMLADIFGETYHEDFQDILDTYYRLAWSRKPEFMGWEREWDKAELADILDTDYSFENYNEAQQRLDDYQRISDLTEKILNQLPDEEKPAFYQLLAYPVQGAYQMNRKFLMAQLSHQIASRWAARESVVAFDSINSLTAKYNSMLLGKWNHMMALAPAFRAKFQNMPKVDTEKGNDVAGIPASKNPKAEGCLVIDLSKPNNIKSLAEGARILRGIGYDWTSVQLGEATSDYKHNQPMFTYQFTLPANVDSVTVHSWSVPFFPLYKGMSNRYGITVDDNQMFVAENKFKENQTNWKDQVLQNGKEITATFCVDKHQKTHTIKLTAIDPGQIIEKVVVDFGGLRKSYIGPAK